MSVFALRPADLLDQPDPLARAHEAMESMISDITYIPELVGPASFHLAQVQTILQLACALCDDVTEAFSTHLAAGSGAEPEVGDGIKEKQKLINSWTKFHTSVANHIIESMEAQEEKLNGLLGHQTSRAGCAGLSAISNRIASDVAAVKVKALESVQEQRFASRITTTKGKKKAFKDKVQKLIALSDRLDSNVQKEIEGLQGSDYQGASSMSDIIRILDVDLKQDSQASVVEVQGTAHKDAEGTEEKDEIYHSFDRSQSTVMPHTSEPLYDHDDSMGDACDAEDLDEDSDVEWSDPREFVQRRYSDPQILYNFEDPLPRRETAP